MQFNLGGLFSALSLLTLMTFTNSNDEGAYYDDFLQYLMSFSSMAMMVFVLHWRLIFS